MAIQTSVTLKSFFETGDFPTSIQFGDLIDSAVPYSLALSNVDLNDKRLLNVNRIGIGTPTPLAALQVNATTNKYIQLGDTASVYTSNTKFSDLVTNGSIISLSRPLDGAVSSSIFTYGTASNVKDNLGIASRDDIVFVCNMTEVIRFQETGIAIGGATAAAKLHLGAGSATAGTAPLKLTAGTNLITPESGAFEFDGVNLYFTVGGIRKTITLV